MEKDKDFAGKNGFIWWTGIVENRNDPLKLGQCQVRCVGWDADNKMHLPTADLPWAKPLLPVNGINVFAPKEGDMVIGFFIDGESAQERVMMGILPNIPLKASNPQQATSRIARNDAASITKTFIQERKDKVVTGIETVNDTWDEPKTKYDTVYPYNNVKETESGHILEFDDTPEKERIHLAHRNGSFNEWFPDGDKVEKVTKDNYQIIMGNDRVYIMGKCFVTVQGDAEIYVKENVYLLVDKNVEATVHGNITAQVDGNMTSTVGGNFKMDVGGTTTFTSGGNFKVTAPRIDLN